MVVGWQDRKWLYVAGDLAERFFHFGKRFIGVFLLARGGKTAHGGGYGLRSSGLAERFSMLYSTRVATWPSRTGGSDRLGPTPVPPLHHRPNHRPTSS